MKCKNAQKLISVKVDNELDETKSQALIAHMKNCSNCKEEYELFAALSSSVIKDKTEIPDNFRANLWNRIDEYELQSKRIYKKWVLAPLYMAAVILFLIFSTSSKLVYAYKSNIKNTGTDKAIVINYFKNCIVSVGFTPLSCLEFMSANKECIHEICCSGSCIYCGEGK